MTLTSRENYRRTVTMTGPEWIPCRVGISPVSWVEYGQEMENVCLRHPLIFPGMKPGTWKTQSSRFADRNRAGERTTDAWGCVWNDLVDGLEGQVVENPLTDWSGLDRLHVPNPDRQDDWGTVDWEKRQEDARRAVTDGEFFYGDLSHGFLFMRLFYLRGFENFMMDLATETPELSRLIDLIADFQQRLIDKWLAIGVDGISFGDDLGTQTSSMIGRKHFDRWMAPAYKRLMMPIRKTGRAVFLHSDGYIMDLMDSLIDCGVSVINPQDRVNGIDNLAEHVKGRIAIELDIDRQKTMPFGTTGEIHDLVEESVLKLGSPAGGLMLRAWIYPPTPPGNVDALCLTLEKFRTHPF